jgi:drug/metabolite transporter (DMT)-like permease
VPSPTPAAAFHFTHRQSLALVFLCTLFGVMAQYLIKSSTAHGVTAAGGGLDWVALATNYALWAGLACYGASTVLLVAALRDGALSLLYPVISLTYVWVILMSYFVFHEALNAWKLAGVVMICLGVTLLGLDGRGERA